MAKKSKLWIFNSFIFTPTIFEALNLIAFKYLVKDGKELKTNF
jgi:hypothetical protein